MKRSLSQMIAIVCILALGFLAIALFLPKADADCNYYSESMCDGAVEYFVEKLNYAISVCPDGDDCEEATQSAFNAKQWAEWVCKHADS